MPSVRVSYSDLGYDTILFEMGGAPTDGTYVRGELTTIDGTSTSNDKSDDLPLLIRDFVERLLEIEGVQQVWLDNSELTLDTVAGTSMVTYHSIIASVIELLIEEFEWNRQEVTIEYATSESVTSLLNHMFYGCNVDVDVCV